jgi:CRP-like cAMP-binding protein
MHGLGAAMSDAHLIETALAKFAPSALALATLRDSVSGFTDLGRGQQLLAEGESTSVLTLLCTGMAKSYRSVPHSSQQTLALFVPGDILDADAFLLGRASAAVSAITAMRVALIPQASFRAAMEDHPEIGWALLRAMARERALLQEWLTGLGRRPARSRAAHLICEISLRLADGREGEGVSEIPLSQIELADLLGLSTVHVNRVMQQLRADGLIDLGRGRMVIRDRARLEAATEFDASYLGEEM